MRPRSHQVTGLVGWLFVVFAAAAAGAIASFDAQAFYAQLVKPEWAPPAGVFGPVWSGALATVEVLVLLFLIAATTKAFWQSSRLAAALLFPYLLWVAFASALTWSVWQANPGLL